MKRASFVALVLLVALFGCHTKNSNESAGTTANTVVPLLSSPQFYTQLKGKVGDQPITMQLMKTAPHLLRGYYAYDSIGKPIGLWGTLDSGLVNIYEETNSDEDRLFSGYLSDDGKFKGVWHGDGTSYHYELHTDLQHATLLKVYYAIDSVKLLPSFTKSPMGTVSNSIIWPDSSVNKEVADFLIQQITGGKGKDPQAYLKRAIDSFMLVYRIAAKDVDTAEFKDGSSVSWNWTTDNDMKVVYNTWPLLVIEKYGYDFTGGAHGNWGAKYQTLDLAKRKALTPDDLFKPGYKEKLSPLLDKAFREKFHLGEEETLDQVLLVKTIPANDNLIVTGKGVCFSYTPYEIGPYAMGQITLFVPFTELKDILK
ncbi:DUF3298 domain-containing protein [Chitinophaga silvatica]|uniref:DUF3298 domain-containing protein n=1 Tax=Chitinophaga silvatica TaxID=2282649 RepID=A0A3E1YB30_9BACT|nr:DUF3298 and DUF4163 domain-containing protein [Chitinophaga silvatica]RFS23272.1 DUF3298 domain-containing protein [Chitinophaga silvatica]